MGKTAENLHDRFPQLTKQRSDAFAVGSQDKLAQAYADGKIQPDLVPVATRHAEQGWGLATADEPPRPGTTSRTSASSRPRSAPHGNVTAGNAAGLNDGATACLLASEEAADRARPAGADAPGVVLASSASSPRSWASARSRPPRRRSPRPA